MTDLPAWATVDQVADHYNISTKHVRRLISDGKLRARRIGKRAIRIERESALALGVSQ